MTKTRQIVFGLILAFSTVMMSACDVSIRDKNDPGTEAKASRLSEGQEITLAGVQTLKVNTTIKVHRLILDETLDLRTHDVALSIDADEIIAKGGLIRNFEESEEIHRQLLGVSGGPILIRAHYAEGALFVISNGTRAGTNLAKAGNGGDLKIQIDQGDKFYLGRVMSFGARSLGAEIQGVMAGGNPGSLCISVGGRPQKTCLTDETVR